MSLPARLARLALLAPLTLFALPPAVSSRGIDPSQYQALRWRLIGPHRGGRVSAVAGVPGDGTTFYMGLPEGGVFKTTDGGNTWVPIFDATHVASVGALALAPSDPSRIYVGTGEMGEGNGVWRSDDAGVEWRRVGLGEVTVISSILVDPKNPDEILVGGLGSAVEPTEGRGVFRSTDGGASWTRVLYRDPRTGVMDLEMDPDDSRVVYATFRKLNLGQPLPKTEVDSWIYKSEDAGLTWHEVGAGLPPEPKGRIGVAVGPGTGGKRVYAIMRQGLFRSDDGGGHFKAITGDTRVVGNDGFSRVFVDPRDADRVWVVQTSLYLSKDGGVTFAPAKGAPGGDDYRTLWIDPLEPRRILVGADQGATISVNGGATWTPWYNQATGQFYHVSVDDQTPYYVYAEQQDSGTVAVASRSDYGEITYRDWFSVGGFEYGYIAPDPLHPSTVYSTGWYGAVVRFDRVTGQISPAFIPGERYKTNRAGPLVYSPRDPHLLYLGTQYLLQTRDGGETWTEMSPDLTVAPGSPEVEIDGSPIHHGVSAVAPSPVDDGLIWVGTSNGRVHHTGDAGRTWREDLIPGGPVRAAVLMIEPSRHDPKEAFVVLRPRGGVFDHAASPHGAPSIFRTRDLGASWQEVATGLPPDDLARALREDPVRKGLLYVATDSGVFVSFDDGELWQSLALNLPTTSFRDLVVKGDDLVAATFGRGLWILDDLEPLRQASAETASVRLLKPPSALRLHWDNDQETPSPPELPAGQNPPDGLVLDYLLPPGPHGEVTLEIRDAQGRQIRRFSSAPLAEDPLPRNVPDYWFGPPETLPAASGQNRFVWNLRLKAPIALPYSYSGKPLTYVEYTLVDDAILGRTPRDQPQGPLAASGAYEAVLTVDSGAYRQPFTVELDPRVALSKPDLDRHFALSTDIARWMDLSAAGHAEIGRVRGALPADKGHGPTALESTLDGLDEGKGGAGFGPVNRDLARLLSMLGEGDSRPNPTLEVAAFGACRALRDALDKLKIAERSAHYVPKPGEPLWAEPVVCGGPH